MIFFHREQIAVGGIAELLVVQFVRLSCIPLVE